jgi:cell division transport system permease protein
MVMRLAYRLRFFARSALQGLRASPVTSAVAVATIAVTLLLGGFFALLLGNMADVAQRFDADLAVTAYLEQDLDADAQGDVTVQAGRLDGVVRATFVSKEEALDRFETGVGQKLGIAEALDENPLPASIEIVLAAEAQSADGVRRVVEALEGLPGVAEVGHGQSWIEGYARALGLARAVGLGFGVVLGLATLLIVANTIRLAVYARRDEIEILALVGASRTFIAIPFLLEGFLQGLLGGACALFLLLGLFLFALPGPGEGLELVLGYERPRFLSPLELSLLASAGALLGSLGSAAALAQGWRR